MTLLLTNIHSEIKIFLSTKVIWEREKRVFITYLSAWGSDQRLGFKILSSRKNEIYLWKMAPNVRMYSATHESVTVGRDMKNTDRVKSQSDCSIRYRALWEKNLHFRRVVEYVDKKYGGQTATPILWYEIQKLIINYDLTISFRVQLPE